MRALLSVANRDGIATLARDLLGLDVEIFATDGTREHLAGEAIEVASVIGPDRTSPSTRRRPGQDLPPRRLRRHPRPARRPDAARRAGKDQGIGPIDLVVVNVKPFAPAIGVKLVGIDEAIEMIDVGGAALLGAAARNSAGVAAASDPSHYPQLLAASCASTATSAPRRGPSSAAEAFSTVAAYHAEIAAYLNQISGNTFPSRLAMVLEKVERPALRREPAPARRVLPRDDPPERRRSPTRPSSRASTPSFNNLLDLDAAYRIARDYTAPTVAIVKHTDPVGLASHDELVEAYRHALETDPVASFGGIVGVNRELDGATAREIAANSYEAVVAPGFSQSALGILRGEDRASSCSPCRPTRPRGCATTASPASTSSASPAACSSRPWTTSGSTAASSRS